MSVREALRHAALGARSRRRDRVDHSETLERPGGIERAGRRGRHRGAGRLRRAGHRGQDRAARYAREHRIPYLGLCLGMQVMCIEFARNVLGLAEANSTEFNPKTPDPVIGLMPDQQGIEDMGGTMRLGL